MVNILILAGSLTFDTNDDIDLITSVFPIFRFFLSFKAFAYTAIENEQLMPASPMEP